MKKIRLLAIVIAVIMAAGLFVLLQKSDKEEVVTVNVVVAVADIPQNTVLTQEHLEVKKIAEEMVLGGTYSSVDTLIGQLAKVDIKAGEQVIADRIMSIGDRTSSNLAMLVEEGKRAISIAVDNVTGVGYMIHPGDMVDVVAHIERSVEAAAGAPANEEEAKETEFVSATIVQNIQVLAVDNVMSNNGKGDGYTTVTLMVTPEEANKIDWGENQGKLRVLLRTPLDEEAVSINKVTESELGIN